MARRIVLGCSLLTGVAAAFVGLTPVGCEALGFKWGSRIGSCVTPVCFWRSTCGEWSVPSLRCKNLKLGDARWKVIFELGEPTHDEGKIARYESEKDRAVVEVEFENDRLTRLSCAPRPRSSSAGIIQR